MKKKKAAKPVGSPLARWWIGMKPWGGDYVPDPVVTALKEKAEKAAKESA